MRTCIGCRQVRHPDQMVRVVLVEGRPVAGRSLPGRGAWLCSGTPECVDQSVKRRAFDRAFRVRVGTVDPEALRALRDSVAGAGTASPG